MRKFIPGEDSGRRQPTALRRTPTARLDMSAASAPDSRYRPYSSEKDAPGSAHPCLSNDADDRLDHGRE